MLAQAERQTTVPPKPPKSVADRDYPAGLKWSLAVHGIFLVAVIVKSLVFPGKPVRYIPSLRVDLVGLPDVLKKDLTAPKGTNPDQLKKLLDKVDRDMQKTQEAAKELAKAKPQAETAAPEEMVLKPKRAAESKQDRHAREKKLKGALARIKALEKISEADSPRTDSARPGPAVLIKGNMLSKGTSLSGDARESAEASYFDALRSRLQDNWALPVWIARQNLSAQVQVFIDSRGRLRNFKFLKFSGNAQFDEAVKRSLSESQPFPPPPEMLAPSVMTDGVLVGFPL